MKNTSNKNIVKRIYSVKKSLILFDGKHCISYYLKNTYK